MKEDKRIGVQGEGSKTQEADVQNAATTDSTDYPADDYLSRDELRVLIAGQDRNISAQAEVIKASQARIRDLQDALDAANELIERERTGRKSAVLDYFDLVDPLPTNEHGGYVCMGDLVEYQGEVYRVIGMSHKTEKVPGGKLIIRREGVDGAKGMWVEACKVSHADDDRSEDRSIEERLRAAGYAPVGLERGLREDAEFWRQQYGKSQLEHMQLTSEYSDACGEIDSLKARLEDAERAGEAIENARSLAVGLENEAARLKSEVADLGASLHAAEAKADRAICAWDIVSSRAEGVMQLLASVASPMEYPAKNAIAILVEVLKDGVDASRKIVGARDAFDFAHKEADHGQA